MKAKILGIAQDAGVPHVGCSCETCDAYRPHPLRVACLGVIGSSGKTYMIDATPDLPHQIRELPEFPSTIFLTHAHAGHYPGLVHLGREGMATKDVPVYATPKMRRFLRDNGPWELLERLRNVSYEAIEPGKKLEIEPGLFFEPVRVPHRNEYADTVAYYVHGPKRTLLYLPDIDRWDGRLRDLLARCDEAWIDGSFFSDGELGPRGRDVPHPPIKETLALLGPEERAKIRFLHFNHTNPVLDPASPERAELLASGARMAIEGEGLDLA